MENYEFFLLRLHEHLISQFAQLHAHPPDPRFFTRENTATPTAIRITAKEMIVTAFSAIHAYITVPFYTFTFFVSFVASLYFLKKSI